MPVQTAELLHAKLQKPVLPHDFVPRPRLTEWLNHAISTPLTLVYAPAGFGKSTLVSSWLEGMTAGRGGDIRPLPWAWLSLDANDSSTDLFLRYFIAALRTIVPGACTETAAMLTAPQSLALAAVITRLNNEILLLPEPLVLVLDDYQSIQGEAVHEFLNALALHWPQPLHLVLISRTMPPLPVADLRAKGQLIELRAHDLRFTRDEIATYAVQALPTPLSESAIVLLGERTEGWATGLRLVTLTLRSGEDPAAIITSLTGSNPAYADYLTSEVLSRQPANVQAFLLRTSILDRFCVSLCEAVLAGEESKYDARACVDWVERANLFVIPLQGRVWYRYHHLFQDALLQRLRAEVAPEQVAELHGRAAAWFAERGQIDEALHHALAANDFELAAKIMQQKLLDVLNQEDRPMLDRWLRLLPEGFVQRHPWLLMMKAMALQFSWQLSPLPTVLRRIEALLDEGDKASSLARDAHDLQTLRGLITWSWGNLAISGGQAESASAFFEEALALLPEEWSFMRGNAVAFLGWCMRALGRGDAAQRKLLDEYESLPWKTSTYAMLLLFAAGLNDLETGRLEPASRMAQRILATAPPDRLLVHQGWARYILGVTHYCWDELDAATQYFAALVDRRYSVHTLALRNGVIGLVRVHLARGKIGAAWQMMELLARMDVEDLGQEADDTRSLRAQLQVLRGETETALRWADGFTAPLAYHFWHWLQNPHLAKAHILLARGTAADVRTALEITAALNEVAERDFNVRFQIDVLAVRALALATQDGAVAALAPLRQAVALAQPGGFIRPFVDLGSPMHTLLLSLREHGFAADFVPRILATFPDPRDKIETGDAGSALGVANAELVESLTRRELEILALLREHLSNREIADRLCISEVTVKRHALNIYGKLGVNKRWAAVAKAETLKLLSPP